MGDILKRVVDFVRNPDFFDGKLKVVGRDVFFTPEALPPSVRGALSYWSGLQISFNYILNVGDTTSVYPFGPIHWVDPSGLKGTSTLKAYYAYLSRNHPGRITRPDYDLAGKGIPDIMSTRPGSGGNRALQQYYEIKPDNAGGKSDGLEKLKRIDKTLERFFKPPIYTRGEQPDIEPLSLQCQSLSCGAGNCSVFLEQRLDPKGLILYKFRLSFAIDPGPFITKGVIAIAIVALIEGGAAALSRAASRAAGGAVVEMAEEEGFKKIRIELLKRVAEHAGSEAVAEQLNELGSEGIIEHTVKKALIRR